MQSGSSRPILPPVEANPCFTWSGVRSGAYRMIPLALTDFLFSMVWGALAANVGLGWMEAMLMNGLVFAGTAQVAALQLWNDSGLAIVWVTLLINCRHLFMGVTLHPWFSRLPASKVYSSAFFLTDETWALTIYFLSQKQDTAFLIGGGLILYVSGLMGVFFGYTTLQGISDPKRWGLNFVSVALLLALLSGMWKGKSDAVPWATAACVAIVASIWLPGSWYILLGTISGSLMGAVRDDD